MKAIVILCFSILLFGWLMHDLPELIKDYKQFISLIVNGTTNDSICYSIVAVQIIMGAIISVISCIPYTRDTFYSAIIIICCAAWIAVAFSCIVKRICGACDDTVGYKKILLMNCIGGLLCIFGVGYWMCISRVIDIIVLRIF